MESSPDMQNGELIVSGIVFVIQKAPAWEPYLLEKLTGTWGKIAYRGKLFPFDTGSYYHPEMGSPLYRGAISFSDLWLAKDLTVQKYRSREMEKQLASVQGRNYNLDVGYIDCDKMVLASFKRSGPKLYIEKGVWADMLLLYQKGKWKPLPWTFPDFCDERYHHDLLRIRENYKSDLKKAK